MSWNYIEATLNLTVVAGLQRTYILQFEHDGGGLVTNCTFDGAVEDANGNVSSVVCWGIGGDPYEVGMQLPGLAAGSYRLEVWVTDDSGEPSRVIVGTVQSMSTSITPERTGNATYRTIVLTLPTPDGERIRARFISSSSAELSATEAKREADRARQEADRADSAAGGISGTVQRIDEQLADAKRLNEEAKGAGLAITNAVASAVYIDGDGNWVIGGVSTGMPSRGVAGRPAYVDEEGRWNTWDEDAQAYVQTEWYAGTEPLPSVGNSVAAGPVYVAADAEDVRAAAVTNVGTVRSIVESMTYRQGDLYTREQTESLVRQRIAENNAGYYTQAVVDAMLSGQAAEINQAWEAAVADALREAYNAVSAAKSELKGWVQEQGYVANSVLSGYVRASSTVKELQVLTEAEHDELLTPSATTVYISGGE